MDFSSFLGNTDIKSRISEAAARQRLPHAILLQGEAGCGKRTFAKLIARALVCENKENAPCGRCPSCIRALAFSHPDIRIEEGSGASHSISVETVKNITADAYRMPEEADVSIYLIFIENKISELAQNKFLKLIEEPPANTVFIFTCKNAEMLLPTIRSRVEVLTILPPSVEEAAGFVSEKLDIDMQRSIELSELCGGNIGRMLEENEAGDQAFVRDITFKIADSIMGIGAHGILETTASLIKDRKLCSDVLSRTTLVLRDACMLKNGGTSTLSGAGDKAVKLCSLTTKRLIRMIEVTESYRLLAERNANMTLLITSYCAELKNILET